MKGFRYLQNVSTLTLNQDACCGCGRCLEVCPHQVFSLDEKKARISDLNACMECGACMMNCPVSALKVDAGVGCATGLIQEWLRERKIFSSGNSCC